MECFKAPIVADGKFQNYGENYVESHAPVVSFAVVRPILYLLLFENKSMAQIDVESAFRNGALEEYIWVTSPNGVPSRPSKVCKLKKAFSLKQPDLVRQKRTMR